MSARLSRHFYFIFFYLLFLSLQREEVQVLKRRSSEPRFYDRRHPRWRVRSHVRQQFRGFLGFYGLWYKRGLLKRAAAAAEGPASVDQWKTSHLMTVRFRVTQARRRQGKSDSHIFFANGEVQWGELHGTACFNPQSVDFHNVSLHPPSSRELFFSRGAKIKSIINAFLM